MELTKEEIEIKKILKLYQILPLPIDYVEFAWHVESKSFIWVKTALENVSRVIEKKIFQDKTIKLLEEIQKWPHTRFIIESDIISTPLYMIGEVRHKIIFELKLYKEWKHKENIQTMLKDIDENKLLVRIVKNFDYVRFNVASAYDSLIKTGIIKMEKKTEKNLIVFDD